jgi:hypothetical protein
MDRHLYYSAYYGLPFGAPKCTTFPSSLNILTSSTPCRFCVPNFLSAAVNFLSSFGGTGCVFCIVLLGVPFPPIRCIACRRASFSWFILEEEVVREGERETTRRVTPKQNKMKTQNEIRLGIRDYSLDIE